MKWEHLKTWVEGLASKRRTQDERILQDLEMSTFHIYLQDRVPLTNYKEMIYRVILSQYWASFEDEINLDHIEKIVLKTKED